MEIAIFEPEENVPSRCNTLAVILLIVDAPTFTKFGREPDKSIKEPVISGYPREIFGLIISQAVPLYLYTF